MEGNKKTLSENSLKNLGSRSIVRHIFSTFRMKMKTKSVGSMSTIIFCFTQTRLRLKKVTIYSFGVIIKSIKILALIFKSLQTVLKHSESSSLSG